MFPSRILILCIWCALQWQCRLCNRRQYHQQQEIYSNHSRISIQLQWGARIGVAKQAANVIVIVGRRLEIEISYLPFVNYVNKNARNEMWGLSLLLWGETETEALYKWYAKIVLISLLHTYNARWGPYSIWAYFCWPHIKQKLPDTFEILAWSLSKLLFAVIPQISKVG